MQTVKKLTVADAEKVEKLETLCFDEPWTKAMIVASLTSPFGYGFLLEEDGEAVAFAIASTTFETAELLDIAVHPSKRGKGLSKPLMDAVQKEAKSRGAMECFLEVSTQNEVAKTLYKSYGFEAVGKRKNYYGDGVDAIVMRKAI